MTKFQEQMARTFAVPMILKLLKSYTATEMTYAINNNINLAKELQEDPEQLNDIKSLVNWVPYIDKVAKNVKSKKWVMWFINDILQKKRPDLYNQIVYNPKGTKYILRQIRGIVNLVFN